MVKFLTMKKLFSSLAILSVLFSFFSGTVYAKSDNQDIPEVDGTYNDPGHPGIKVRVFVHREKPGVTPNPSLACSLSDPESSAVDAKTGWKLPSGVLYNLNVNSVPTSVGQGNLSVFSATALSRWASASNGKVLFTRGADTNTDRQANDGKNVITWGRTSGSALAVTYTRYNTATGQVVDVDTIMNNKFAWSWTDQNLHPACASSNTYDAQDILTHELGHWMGLDDHYSADYVNSTMYGYGSKTEIKKDTLTTGDTLGVQAIYN